jgi:Tol biopolymer transport system component
MVFARDLAGKGRLYPIGGGEAKEIPGWLPKDNWAGWSEDGRTAYVFHNERTFATAYRLDLGTGKRQTVGTLAPPDPAGVTFINEVLYTPDGKAYVYTYQTERSDLFLVEGVR